jgi:hypothetical protein
VALGDQCLTTYDCRGDIPPLTQESLRFTNLSAQQVRGLTYIENGQLLRVFTEVDPDLKLLIDKRC